MTAADPATVARIAADLGRLGVRPGGVLLVHSSLSSLGWVHGGAETVVAGLQAALGPQGTLLLPALSYATVTAANPRFDRERTPACVGAIPEHFRTRPGTLRSGSPTHSVCAAGPLAAPIVADHERDTTPVGPRSPLRRLRDLDGQLLFLGCGMNPNTSMHGIEELVDAPYLFGGEVAYDLLLGGERRRITCRRHAFAGWRQCYFRMRDLLRGEELREARVLAATAQLVAAAVLWARGEAALRRDPFAFVEPETAAPRG